jgi:hypothetical protein
MALQIEHMDDALPDRLALKNLFHGLDRDQRGRAAVLRFDGAL